MKKFLALLLVLIFIFSAVFTIRFIKSPEYCEKTAFALNTAIKITVYAKNASSSADDALKEIYRIDSLMNAHNPSSEISKINSSPDGAVVSKEVFELIKTAVDISYKTDGAFDITLKPVSDLWNITSENPKVPEPEEIKAALSKTGFKDILLDNETCMVSFKKAGMAIDLGAIAKGYAADRAADVLKKSGVKSALLDLGGNVYAIGRNRYSKKWKIGLQTPWAQRGEYFRVEEIEDSAVVTSGAYERYFEKDGEIYHHIIDPKTGYPAQSDISGVTVICENSALADALSTTIFVSGEKGAKKALENFKEIEIIIMTNSGKTKQWP